jgi:hypothetical protein
MDWVRLKWIDSLGKRLHSRYLSPLVLASPTRLRRTQVGVPPRVIGESWSGIVQLFRSHGSLHPYPCSRAGSPLGIDVRIKDLSARN